MSYIEPDQIRGHIARLRRNYAEWEYWHGWGKRNKRNAKTKTDIFPHIKDMTWGDISKMTREELIEWLETNLAVMNVLSDHP